MRAAPVNGLGVVRRSKTVRCLTQPSEIFHRVCMSLKPLSGTWTPARVLSVQITCDDDDEELAEGETVCLALGLLEHGYCKQKTLAQI